MIDNKIIIEESQPIFQRSFKKNMTLNPQPSNRFDTKEKNIGRQVFIK